MENSNKLNTLYFEHTTMKGLYNTIESWQAENRKRLLSVNIQKDGDNFCCIALTNPSEVMLVDFAGSPLPLSFATVINGRLQVDSHTTDSFGNPIM